MASRKILVLISGPIAAGKSKFVAALIEQFGFEKLSSGLYLRNIALANGLSPDRGTLTSIGDSLDIETDFAWVVTRLAKSSFRESPLVKKWVFDSVRKKKQVAHFRKTFPELIKHVHLYADELILKDRFNKRKLQSSIKDNNEYELATDTPNEREARSLKRIADISFDTGTMSSEEIAIKVSEFLND